MKVVILCGGQGTRLREETDFRPKPMVPIGERPILWHIMKYYAHFGFNDFILCLGYKGEVIKDYFRNYLWNTCDVTLKLGRSPGLVYHNRHDEEDWSVTLAETGLDSLTARRVKRIQPFIPEGEPFLLTYGDGLGNVDLRAAVKCHREAGRLCTLTAVHPAGRFGALTIEEDGAIHTFVEKPQVEKAHVNGGYMVCEYQLFEYLRETENEMLEQRPMLDLTRNRQLNSYRHEGWWQCMDTYREMQYLNDLWVRNAAPWKVW